VRSIQDALLQRWHDVRFMYWYAVIESKLGMTEDVFDDAQCDLDCGD
jgi:hypothetical protein